MSDWNGRKLTLADFARLYPPLKARGMSQLEISKELNVSRPTLCRYLKQLHDTEMIQISEVLQDVDRLQGELEQGSLTEGAGRAEEIINLAYEKSMEAIQALTNMGEHDKAADLSLKALSIARLIYSKERVINALQVNIDSRSVNTITLESIEDLEKLLEANKAVFARWVINGADCPVCGREIG